MRHESRPASAAVSARQRALTGSFAASCSSARAQIARASNDATPPAIISEQPAERPQRDARHHGRPCRASFTSETSSPRMNTSTMPHGRTACSARSASGRHARHVPHAQRHEHVGHRRELHGGHDDRREEDERRQHRHVLRRRAPAPCRRASRSCSGPAARARRSGTRSRRRKGWLAASVKASGRSRLSSCGR